VLRRSADEWSLNALVSWVKGSQEEGKQRGRSLRKKKRRARWRASEPAVMDGAVTRIRSPEVAVALGWRCKKRRGPSGLTGWAKRPSGSADLLRRRVTINGGRSG
jgi:hypothetical protein